MKKAIIPITVLSVLFVFLFTSCSKYEEGPSFTLLTKKARLTGTWVLQEQSINGTSVDLGLTTIKYTLEKDGTGNLYSKTTVIISVETNTALEWKFDDKKENLMIKTNGESDFSSTEIIRLTNSELWLRNISGSITTITKYKAE